MPHRSSVVDDEPAMRGLVGCDGEAADLIAEPWEAVRLPGHLDELFGW